MTIAFNCPRCNQPYRVPDEVAGRATKCKKCGSSMMIPQAAGGGFQLVDEPAAFAAPARWPQAASGIKRRARGNRYVALGVVLLQVVAFSYVLAYGVMGGWPTTLGGDELKYLPDGCEFIGSMRLDQILESEAYKEVKKELPKELMEGMVEGMFKAQVGLPMDNVERATAGGTLADSRNSIVVVRTKKAVTADEIKGNMKGLAPSFQEIKEGNYTLHEGGGKAFCVADSQVVIYGPAEALKKVLARNKKTELTDGMKAALKLVDLNKSAAFAFNLKDVKVPEVPAKPPGPGPMMIDPQQIMGQATTMLKEVEAAGFQLNATADIQFELLLLCKDSSTADDYRAMVEGSLVFMKKMVGLVQKDESITKQANEVMSGLKVSSSFSTVKVTGKVKVAPVLKLYKDKTKAP